MTPTQRHEKVRTRPPIHCLAFGLGALLSIAGCGSSLSEVVIPKTAIQAAMDAYTPMEVSDSIDQELPVRIIVTELEVLLEAGADEIGVDMSLTVDLPEMSVKAISDSVSDQTKLPVGMPAFPPGPANVLPIQSETFPARRIKGKIVIFAGVRYDSETASFHCDDARTSEIVFTDLPSQFEPIVCEACEQAMNQYFSNHSVYQLSGDQATIKLAKATMRDVSVENGQLVVELGW